ncbi:MAG: hypothetical protein P4L46_01445 [Fimbriimonas sp.]|nr:hypothetical protein [Fimbriimonas sp.]
MLYYGRRSLWLSAISLLFLAFVFVYFLWLKPWLFHTMNPIEPSPPAWGSTKALATDAGFMQGKWIAHLDESTARRKDEIAHLIMNSSTDSLEFTSGDRFVWSNGREVVKGRWTNDARDIEFDPDTVDGVPVKTALERLVGQRALPMKSPYRNGTWREEGSSVELVQRLGPIQLMPDQKRLFCAGNVDQNGQTFLGTRIWERVKRHLTP